jgi:hypothetical protein
MGDCVICKRCKRVEKQRDELVKTLEMLEKIFADKDFIEEDESEDFLNDVWTLAHGALYDLKRELAQEAQPCRERGENEWL